MKGVEFIQSAKSSISTASTNSMITQPLNTNNNVNAGLDTSIYAQANTSQSGQETTSKATKNDDGLVSLTPTFIKGIKVICATYESEIQAELVYVDKMLEVYLKNLGPIKSPKFNVKNLYYEVVVRFNGKQVKNTIKDQWSLRFCKYAFRIFPSNLTKNERNLHFKYGLKLANLPNGTYAADLKDVLTQVDAISCFISKNRFSQNYEKERFTFIFFDNQNSYNNALGKKFSYNN
ncbi:hypothetical protein C1646_749650 [Rhizophagus diaphanus]|nr:hypothetical protein C1646_749650 [Rhizophagus diaphanus] [Rhizophagus sp. MUCL 43196]